MSVREWLGVEKKDWSFMMTLALGICIPLLIVIVPVCAISVWAKHVEIQERIRTQEVCPCKGAKE